MRNHLRVSSLSCSSSTVNLMSMSTGPETSAPRLLLRLLYRTVFTVASASSVASLAHALGSTSSPFRLHVVVGDRQHNNLGQGLSTRLELETFFLQCVFRAQVASLIRHCYNIERRTVSVHGWPLVLYSQQIVDTLGSPNSTSAT